MTQANETHRNSLLCDDASPWSGVLAAGRHGRRDGNAGLRVEPFFYTSMFSLIERRAAGARFGDDLQRMSGLHMPVVGGWEGNDAFRIAFDGVGRWRVMSNELEPEVLTARLTGALGEVASIVDQSHSAAVLRLSGPRVHDVLARGTSHDLQREFGVGRVALTTFEHMPVHLSQLSDAPMFEVQVFRSMAGSLRDWIMAIGAKFGVETVLN